MKRKKGKFLTFLFSLIPGAGHMYMGFMKIGLSLMSAFSFIIFLSSWLNIGPLLLVLPIIWFFSFFDSINRHSSSDEEFAQLDDGFLLSIDMLLKSSGNIFKKQNIYAGILLIVFGIYLVWNNIMSRLWGLLPENVYYFVNGITSILPQLVIGIMIIFIGVRLISVKKRESGEDV
ncbi:MAG: hypothetical protein ACOX25_09475 [Caldicoprobacterales bacterium]|jgi:hypothetical protein|nr:hypothetical protein [Clostridiales bacterium]